MTDLHRVRIVTGPENVFTRVYIDGQEFRGVTRVWFDTGEINDRSGPRRSYMNHTVIHLTFYPAELIIEADTQVDAIEQRPATVTA